MQLGTVVPRIVALDGGYRELEVAGVGPSNSKCHGNTAGTVCHIRGRDVVITICDTCRKGTCVRRWKVVGGR